MTPTKLEDTLKSYLLNPMRNWKNFVPVIGNYNDGHNLIEKYKKGININTTSCEYSEEKKLGGKKYVYKTYIVALEFYSEDIGKSKILLENQQNINSFFNDGLQNHLEVAQLVKLENQNNNWILRKINNDQDFYNFYGSSKDPDLSTNISYGGYLIRDDSQNHFLFRTKSIWKVLNLQTHLVHNVSRFNGDEIEIFHGGDTFIYEFEKSTVFLGSQFITIDSSNLLYREEDQNYGDMIRSDTILNILDYEDDLETAVEPVFEYVTTPAQPYSPTPYAGKFLVAATSTDSNFSEAEWRMGNKTTNSNTITFSPTTTNTYRGVAFSRNKLSGFQQTGNVFGNIISAYNYNGIIDIDNIKYYSYITKHPYFPVPETHEYTINPLVDESLIVDYLSGDTGNIPSASDFSFSSGEIELNSQRPYYELSIGTSERSYIAFACTNQILRIMSGTTNLRHSFSPSVDSPFVQREIRGKIYNIFISNTTIFEYTSWRLFFDNN